VTTGTRQPVACAASGLAPLAVDAYLRRYEGQRFTIVGKGPTRFRFENLVECDGPVIFLNDAVQFEAFAANAPETFFFAHDKRQEIWLPRIRSTAVLPESGAEDSGAGRPMISVASLDVEPAGPVVSYRWGGWYGDGLARHTREDVAASGQLALNCGTIHSAIHFAWLCGAGEVRFVGCDGFAPGYDDRVSIDSGGRPLGAFAKIRQVQDRMCCSLQLPTRYVNEARLEPAMPRKAHFIWFGPVPSWVRRNVETFGKMHPAWDVKLWQDLPADMPEDLAIAAVDNPQLCSRSDILSYWLLHTRGGIYLDCDAVTLRSFEPLRNFDAWVWLQHDGRLNCSAMGSAPGSTAFELILQAVREVAREAGPKIRTSYGPKLLTDLFGSGGERSSRHMDVLPTHYFGLLVDQKQAQPFWRASRSEREAIIDMNRHGITDPVEPYSIHLWGVDGSSLRGCFGRGDALGTRLRYLAAKRGPIRGAEVGVLTGRLSEHVLRMVPELYLYMVDRWAAVPADSRYARSGDTAAQLSQAEQDQHYESAKAATEFAKERRELIRMDSAEAAKACPDGALDFVFIDADHTYEGARDDIAAWARTVRPGGMLCGHDIDNPAGGVTLGNANWGVRKAVEEFLASGSWPGATLELGGEFTWYVRRPE